MIASLFKNSSGHTRTVRTVSVMVAAAVLLAACGGGAPTVREPKPRVSSVDKERGVPLKNEAPDAESKPKDINQAETDKADTPENLTISVGIMLPLSGPEEAAGKALLRAATMALFDAYDPRLKLIPYDTQADALVAEQQALKAVEDGVSVVLGPLLSDSVRAAGDVFADENITVIGFSNDSNVSAPGRYLMGFLPEAEVKRVIDYAVLQGHENFGALIPEGLYGRRVRTAFGDTIVDAGATIESIESYPPGTPEALDEPVKRLARYDERRNEARREMRFLRSLRDDLTNEIADRIEDAEVLEGVDFDAVLLPEGGALMRSLAPLLPFYEIDPNDVQLLGTGLWNDAGLLGEPPMQGAWFAAPEPEAPSGFLSRYEATYGAAAPRIATLAYDAMALVAQLARTPLADDLVEENANVESDNSTVQPETEKDQITADKAFDTRSLFSRQRLTLNEGYVGVDGLFRFLANGAIERSLAILEVNRNGFAVVDAAPKSFPAFGYLLN